LLLFLKYVIMSLGDSMRNIIVTGGTRGIGRAITKSFIEQGERVFAIYEKNEEQAKVVENLGAIIIKADISKSEDVSKIIDTVHQYGKTDVLVNNAGIAQIKPFAEITENDWDRIFDVNVKGMFLMSRAVLTDMLQDKKGKIINISSVWGQTGGSCEVHYSATKGAINSFTKALAKELGLSGITVNAVAPGIIDTEMNKEIDKVTMAELKEEIPLAKIGTPHNVADTVAFLASEKADYITGEVISVNGGFYI